MIDLHKNLEQDIKDRAWHGLAITAAVHYLSILPAADRKFLFGEIYRKIEEEMPGCLDLVRRSALEYDKNDLQLIVQNVVDEFKGLEGDLNRVAERKAKGHVPTAESADAD